jgi:hypothetical protein
MERVEALKLRRRFLEWEAEGRRRKGRPKKNGCSKTENELPRTDRKRNYRQVHMEKVLGVGKPLYIEEASDE